MTGAKGKAAAAALGGVCVGSVWEALLSSVMCFYLKSNVRILRQSEGVGTMNP